MTNSIVPLSTQQQNQSSPFDAIRGYRADGSEFWTARELMKWLGYAKWDKFQPIIKQAIENIDLSIGDATRHVTLKGNLGTYATLANPRNTEDYELSRLGCYHIALACNGKGKPMVAMAKQYFAAKTRQAEVIIPAQNDRIRELELEVRALELRKGENDRQDFRIGAYGMATTLLLEGKGDAIVEIDRPTIEVIDNRSGAKFSGQTTKQLADYLNKNGGRSFKSGAELERELAKLGRADLIDTVPRSTLQPFVSKENLEEACRILVNNRKQMLLGA